MKNTVYILIAIETNEYDSPTHILGVYATEENALKAGAEAFKQGGFYAWDVKVLPVID